MSERRGSRRASNPACDLHISIQMEATTFMTPGGRILGYICPVPSCGRHYDGVRYFDKSDTTFAGQDEAPTLARQFSDSQSRLP